MEAIAEHRGREWWAGNKGQKRTISNAKVKSGSRFTKMRCRSFAFIHFMHIIVICFSTTHNTHTAITFKFFKLIDSDGIANLIPHTLFMIWLEKSLK